MADAVERLRLAPTLASVGGPVAKGRSLPATARSMADILGEAAESTGEGSFSMSPPRAERADEGAPRVVHLRWRIVSLQR